MLYGYAGKMLKVDVGNGLYSIDNTPPGLAEDYLGGRGFTARLLYDNLPDGIEPFS